jgi:hypothetical protein
MPSHEEHCQESLKKYGKRFDALHSWMDEPCDIQGKTHRMFRHDLIETPNEAKKLFGNFADHACLDHIRLDKKSSREAAVNTHDILDSQSVLAEIEYNVLNEPIQSIGNMGEIFFERVCASMTGGNISVISSKELSPGGKRYPLEELDIAHVKWLFNKLTHWFGVNIFSETDVRFILTEVAHGRGSPSFDYVGIDKTQNDKILLDVKCRTEKEDQVPSKNQRLVKSHAEALGFKVYLASITFLQNWNTKIIISNLTGFPKKWQLEGLKLETSILNKMFPLEPMVYSLQFDPRRKTIHIY